MAYGNRWRDIKKTKVWRDIKKTKVWTPKRRYFKSVKATKEEIESYTIDDVPEYLRKYL